MRTGIGTYILIILLVLILFGLISIGDVLSVVFYIIAGVLGLAVIGAVIFRIKMNRIRKQMQEGGNTYRTYTWGMGGARNREQKKKDGEITVQQTQSTVEKTVRNEVGDYVEYEEIREEPHVERTKEQH